MSLATPSPATESTGVPMALEVKELVVEYRRSGRGREAFRAVDGVSLQVLPGETVAVVGGSGSGKTTIGRAVLGLTEVTSGAVLLGGRDITHASSRERRRLAAHLQVVFQDPYSSLNPAMTIEDILSEPLVAAGDSSRDARAKVRRLLERVQLPASAAQRMPREFSGGQRQRVAIARALTRSPRVIICDEPTSALDLSTQARILDLLIEIQQTTGVAYLFISHQLDVVKRISHRVAVIDQGRIVETGSTEAVVDSPSHPYTRKLFLSAPIADPRRQAERRAERQSLLAAERAVAVH